MSNSLKILARDFVFRLNTGSHASPVWVVIGGITSFSPGSTGNRTQTTTFDDVGWLTNMVASRGGTVSLEGQMIEDESDGARDAGQEACEAWAMEMAQASVKEFQIETPGGTTATWEATAVAPFATGSGGGNDDAAGWTLDIEFSGAPTISGAVAAPSTPGVPTPTAGNDLVDLVWTGSAGTGGHFEIVSVKTSDSSEISRLASTSPYTFNGLASGAAYKFKVRAVGATGKKSDWTALSAEATTT